MVRPGRIVGSSVSGTEKSSLIKLTSLIVAISVPALTTAPAEMLRSDTQPEKGARTVRSPIVAWTRDAFRDLLKIRKSTTLLRLRTAEDIKARLSFLNTGSSQEATVLVGRLNGVGYPGANFDELVYLINVDKTAKALTLPTLAGRALELHPVHTAPGAADRRAAQATFDRTTGSFNLPARTAVVFVARPATTP